MLYRVRNKVDALKDTERKQAQAKEKLEKDLRSARDETKRLEAKLVKKNE